MTDDIADKVQLRDRISALNEEVRKRLRNKRKRSPDIDERMEKTIGPRTILRAEGADRTTGTFLTAFVLPPALGTSSFNGYLEGLLLPPNIEGDEVDVRGAFKIELQLLCEKVRSRAVFSPPSPYLRCASYPQMDVSFETALKSRAVELFCSLSIRVPGTAKQVVLRASPSFRSLPWFDFVKVKRGDGVYAARLLSIVSVKGLSFAFVEFFVSALLPKAPGSTELGAAVMSSKRLGVKKPAPIGHRRDLSLRHPKAGLPVIKPAYGPERYGMIDTHAVIGGLWVHGSFRKKGEWWVLHHGDDLCV
jgi:hypothetical protein